MSRMQSAKIYLRNNGTLGSQCDGCRDTGHTINEYNGLFTVWSLDGDEKIAVGASRADAERAITADWRAGK